MKSFSLKFGVVLLTFLIGIGGFLAYWNIQLSSNLPTEAVAPSLEPTAIQTTVCQLINEQKNLPDKTVSFEATAYVINDETIILYGENCSIEFIDIMFARLGPESHSVLINNLRMLLEGKDRESKKDFKEVTVKVIGTAKISADATGFQYISVTPVNIKIVSPFRKFTPKGAA